MLRIVRPLAPLSQDTRRKARHICAEIEIGKGTGQETEQEETRVKNHTLNTRTCLAWRSRGAGDPNVAEEG